MDKYIVNKPGKQEIELRLNNEGERLEWIGIVDARVKGEYELNITMSHVILNTFGRILLKGVVGNGSIVKVKGLIKIEKLAQESDSFLTMKFLLLDKKSAVTIIPELEIEADSVKVGHSASVGKIDEEQLLYLKSRGVGQNEAKTMIINSFMN